MRVGNLAFVAAFSFTAASTALASGNVWTVDDNQPANYATIQAAIDAASDGDVILVASGNYAGFTVANKDLRILGAPSKPLVSSASKIQGLAAGKTVVLASLRLRTAAITDTALSVGNASGAVRVQACDLGATALSASALNVAASSDVVLGDCVMQGSDGGGGQYFGAGGYYGVSGEGGHGSAIDASNVALWSSPCTGGNAGTATHWVHCCPTGRGGDGLHGNGGFFFANGSALSGGHGGNLSISTNVCVNSSNFQELGRGGHGCSFEGALVSQAWFSIPTLALGAGGSSNCTYSFDEWPPAKLFKRGPAGSIAKRVASGGARAMTLPSLLQATNTASAAFRGAPFETVDVVISPLTAFTWNPANSGVWSVSQAAALPPQSVGACDVSGNLAANVVLPALAAGVATESWFVQPLFTGPLGIQRLGTPYCVTLTH